MLLLEQNIIGKSYIIKGNKLLELEQNLDTRNNKEYEIKTICNSKIYAKKALNQLLKLYYLVFWKSFLKDKNTWRPILALVHF